MNSIDQRLARLRAKLSGLKRESLCDVLSLPPRERRWFRVTSGNVVMFICEKDQNSASKCFGGVLSFGPPFEESMLGELMEIKDMQSDHVWFASTMACLSAIPL